MTTMPVLTPPGARTLPHPPLAAHRRLLTAAGLVGPAALLFLLPQTALWAGVLVAALVAWSAARQQLTPVFQCAAVWAAVYLFSALVGPDPWPTPALVGLLLGGAVISRRPAARRQLRERWLHRGDPNRTTWLLVLATVVISSGAILIWSAVEHPDTASFRQTFGGLPWPLLIPLGVLLAAINAVAEESLFRGLLMSALADLIGRDAVIIGLQGIAFGLLHATGFPGGPSGMVLAAIYGLMLGTIRKQSGGMLANWVAHLAADSLIFCILVGLL